MMNMIRLDELPPPIDAKKGRFTYVNGHPAPIWVEDKFDWWLLIKRAGLLIGLLTGIVAFGVQVVSLL